MDQNSSLGVVYDFSSQAGITSILMAIRSSELSSVEKNELRDLVLLFINGGKDETVRISLEQKLNIHNIKPLPPKQKIEDKPIPLPDLPFGTLRPTPSFSAPNPTFNKSTESAALQPSETNKIASPSAVPDTPAPSAPKEEVVADVPQNNNAVPVPVLTEEKQVPVSAPVVASPVPVDERPASSLGQPVNNPQTAPNPVVQNSPQDASPFAAPPVAEASIAKPAIVNESVPQVATPTSPVAPRMPEPVSNNNIPAPQAESKSQSDVNTNYLDRIREIKQNINSKVGNPVNLIDIDNVAGREYMNALLDAMKKVNGGIGGIDIAMQRLELAYSAVETAILNHRNAEGSVSENKTQENVPSKSAPETVVVPETPTPEVSNTPPVEKNSIAEPQPQTIPPLTPQDTVPLNQVSPFPSQPSQTEEPKAVGSVPLGPLPEIKEEPSGFENANNQTPAPTQQTQFTPTPIPTPQAVNSSVPAQSQTPSPVTAQPPIIPSLAEEKKSLTMSDIPDTLPRSPQEMSNPLFAREIDDGLEQLLSDWSLFKKSGLFGTGQKGSEHPLFKKISGLQIPLLLAGRFEGATQEIKQSITDYMNGWRYEQGIIYEQGETFEMYLRRVIKHIIDLQNKRNQA